MPRARSLRSALAAPAALAGYAALAVLYTWPLTLHLSTRIQGTLGETAGSVWALWHFRHSTAVLGSNPFWTDLLYWPYGANMLLMHCNPLHGLLGCLLIPKLGLIASYNLLLLAGMSLSALAVFLLLRDWRIDPGIAFVAGGVFPFSLIMSARMIVGGATEYLCVQFIPLFVWTFSRAIRDGKLRDAVLAALCLTGAWNYNYYHFLGLGLLIPWFFLLLEGPVTLAFPRREGDPLLRAARPAAGGLMLAAASWVGWSLFTVGQVAFHGGGSARAIVLYVAPYLAFWASLGVFLAFRRRLEIRCNPSAFSWRRLSPYVAVAACWAALNLPLIWAVLHSMLSGDYGVQKSPWRGGGNPQDLAILLMPNPYHPLWGARVTELLDRWLPTVMRVNSEASYGLIPTAAILWFWKRGRRDAWTSLWLASFALFFTLCLGPMLKVFGFSTYLPLPFFFLHLLPFFNNFPNGMYFNQLAMLFAALCFAAALQSMKGRLPARAARWAAPAALALVGFEFTIGPCPDFAIEQPALIHRLRARPQGAVFPVPVGINFHILLNPGWLGAEFLDLWTAQMIDEKPYVGGSLGRVARRTCDLFLKDPVFQAVLSAQQGADPGRLIRDKALMRRYLRDMHVTYVLAKDSLLTPALRKAMAVWPMRLIDQDGDLRLYAVAGPG